VTGSVRLSVEGAVATVLFDRPEARNAMTLAMYDELSEACMAIAAAPGLRAAIFRGAGRAFVAGTDISEFLAFRDGADGIAYERRIERGLAEIEALPIPTLAVVDGAAMGGGLMIATACDFRLASTRARFGVPIASTVGNCLSTQNVGRLERAFGIGATRRMLLLADHLDPMEAAACGFVLATVEEDELLAKSEAIVRRLVTNAPLSIAAARDFLRETPSDADDEVIARVYGSRDFREGVAAFLEKRSPRWAGA
jgi:enoyl-CoA hydratase